MGSYEALVARVTAAGVESLNRARILRSRASATPFGTMGPNRLTNAPCIWWRSRTRPGRSGAKSSRISVRLWLSSGVATGRRSSPVVVAEATSSRRPWSPVGSEPAGWVSKAVALSQKGCAPPTRTMTWSNCHRPGAASMLSWSLLSTHPPQALLQRCPRTNEGGVVPQGSLATLSQHLEPEMVY